MIDFIALRRPMALQVTRTSARTAGLGLSFVSFLFLVLTSFSVCFGQGNAADGAIDGYVVNQNGGQVDNAEIRIRNIDTNVASNTISKQDGYFRFALVPLGRYEVTVIANGYAKYVSSGITVSVGSQIRISPRLSLAGVSEQVVVTADASILTAGNSSVGGLIAEREMRMIPVTSRNVYNLFLFTPGVKGVPSTTFGTPTYSFGGLMRSSWNVDGLDDTARRNTSPIRLVINTPETVEQVQVLANGYQSEFGFTAGGQMNLVTRAGTNDLHASATYLNRPQFLSATPGLSTKKQNLNWYMFDFNVGGPLLRNRVFFFANYEHNPYTLPNAVTITAANAAALGLTATDTATQPFGETYDTPSARVDFTMSERNTGFVRYSKFHNWEPYVNAGGLNAAGRSINYTDSMNGGEAQLATTVSPQFLNELRYGVNRRDLRGVPAFAATSADAYTTISGVAGIGNNSSGNDSIETSNQVVDNMSWQHGRHFIKFGGAFSLTQYYSLNMRARTFSFSGIAKSGNNPAVSALNQYLNTIKRITNPATGKPYTYTTLSVDFGDPSISRNTKLLSGFVQDEYRASSRLTFYAGLRYEKIFLPRLAENPTYVPAQKVRASNFNVAPRLAFSWMPRAEGKTVVRGAFGIFFDTPNVSLFTNAASQDGNTLQSYTIPGAASTAPVYPNLPASVDSSFAGVRSILFFDPNFRMMYAEHANLQVERELATNLSIKLQYMFVASHFGTYLHDTNLGSPVNYLADGRPVYSSLNRPNKSFGALNMYSSGGNTNYNGVDVVLMKRFSHGLLFNAYYSYSHALGDADQTGVAVSDVSDRARDYGNMSSDLRHYFSFRGSYQPHIAFRPLNWLNGFTASTIAMVNSGYPLNPLAGADLNGDLVSNDRPLFMQRNSFRGPGFQQVDARLSRTFTFAERYHVEGMIEAENLLNHLNANCTAAGCNSAINAVYSGASFGRITTARTPRRLQIGGRFYF